MTTKTPQERAEESALKTPYGSAQGVSYPSYTWGYLAGDADREAMIQKESTASKQKSAIDEISKRIESALNDSKYEEISQLKGNVEKLKSTIIRAILALNHNSKEDVQKALRQELEKYE